jgi:hypothetical protein
MARVKPTAIVTVHRWLHRLGPQAEAALLSRLTPATADLYRRIQTVAWITHKEDAELLTAAAQTLYGEDPEGMRRLGSEVAKLEFSEHFQSTLILPTLALLFKQVFRHASELEPSEPGTFSNSPLTFVFQRLPELFQHFYDAGEIKVVEVTSSSAVLVMSGLPDVPRPSREFAAGFMERIMLMAGAKQARVGVPDDGPEAWRYPLSWE